MEQVYDSKNQEHEFSVGDWVFLKLQLFRQMSLVARKNYKFSPQIYGSFWISKRIGKIAYKLDLTSYSRQHPVFHVSVLKKKIGEE